MFKISNEKYLTPPRFAGLPLSLSRRGERGEVRKDRRSYGITILFFLLLLPASAFAASIFFESKSPELARDEEFLVNVFLNTEGEYPNAVEGKITFPVDLLEVKEIRDGNSVINFWIQRPAEKQGEIVFSGITPGGLFGEKGFLFSVLFQAEKSGSGSINFDEIKVLKNDGKGTPAETKISNFQFSIFPSTDSTSPEQAPTVEIKDTEPPESFRPEIGSDPEIFNGKYFLVFITQDKGTGLDYYEVREGFWGKYVTAVSPYLLKNQSLNKKIYVKAVDKAKNERTVTFKSDQWKWYKQYPLLGIILVLIVALGFAFKKTWLKK